MPAPLIELLCCLLDVGASGALAGGLHSVTTPNTKLNTPQQRQAKQVTPCALDGCYALSFRTTDFCWKHQDIPNPVTETEADANWWEDEN